MYPLVQQSKYKISNSKKYPEVNLSKNQRKFFRKGKYVFQPIHGRFQELFLINYQVLY